MLERYERELFGAGRFVDFVQLGIVRYLLTAPIDFLQRVDALRAVCPEIDRMRTRETLRAKVAEWQRQVEIVDRAVEEGSGDGEMPERGEGD